MHHFAFLRSWFLGLDLRQAWQRYLAFSALSDDLRHIEHCRSALLRQVLADAHQLNLRLPPAEQISVQLGLLAQAPFGASSAPLPTLDDFIDAQGLDREFYSEAELLQEYRLFHHLDGLPDDAAPLDLIEATAGGHAAAQGQVRALNRVEALLARRPEAADRLDLWLSPALAALLKRAGIGTLGALADTVRIHGHRWHARASGLGERRAAALVAWLAPLAETFGHAIPDAARAPMPRQRALQAATLQRLNTAPRFALVPLEQLAVPARLAGGPAAPGRATAGVAAPPGAPDDLQALRAWLATHAHSGPTHRAYAKEVERFYLWCLHVRGKPLSRVDAADCLAYRDFLTDLPADWVNPRPTPRLDPAWRPFRGPLAASSQKYAMVVLQAMFDGLCAAGHLAGNPLRGMGGVRQPTLRQADLVRAFTAHEWAFVHGQLDRLGADGGPLRGAAERRRLRLLLDMLAATGLRLAEIAGATVDDIRAVQMAGEAEPVWVIQVRGTGRKRRDVPLGDDIRRLIALHHQDAACIAALPSPAPIVCTLGERPRRWIDGADGAVQLSPTELPGVRALSAAGIYLTLKRFFRRISTEAAAVDGLSRERLLAASTHWLRHTFGRHAAGAGVPVEVLRQVLGHASLASTGIYLDGERSDWVPALRDLRLG